MTDVNDLYKAAMPAMPKPPEEKPERGQLRGLSPQLEKIYSLWDQAIAPTEKAIEARRIVNRQGLGR